MLKGSDSVDRCPLRGLTFAPAFLYVDHVPFVIFRDREFFTEPKLITFPSSSFVIVSSSPNPRGSEVVLEVTSRTFPSESFVTETSVKRVVELPSSCHS